LAKKFFFLKIQNGRKFNMADFLVTEPLDEMV
jgi:hypothetical protein